MDSGDLVDPLDLVDPDVQVDLVDPVEKPGYQEIEKPVNQDSGKIENRETKKLKKNRKPKT